jgi:hypothetical protein
MNATLSDWEILIRLCAMVQLGVALLNLFLSRILHWEDELARLPLLLHEVFQIHAWFISITLAIFGVMTWRFAHEMAAGTNDALRWLAAGIGSFWAIRTVLQVTYYSSSHWRGRAGRTAIHIMLLILYGGLAGCYVASAAALAGGFK